MSKPYVHLYLGEPGDEPQAVSRRFLLSALKPMREEFARRLKELRKKFPRHKLPCETCAFRSGTDNDKGFEATIMAFVVALHNKEPFLCHHGMKRDSSGQWRPWMKGKGKKKTIDWRKNEFCVAHMVLTTTVPEPFDVHTVVPEIVCEGLATIVKRP